jgi:hypothetical protein
LVVVGFDGDGEGLGEGMGLGAAGVGVGVGSSVGVGVGVGVGSSVGVGVGSAAATGATATNEVADNASRPTRAAAVRRFMWSPLRESRGGTIGPKVEPRSGGPTTGR